MRRPPSTTPRGRSYLQPARGERPREATSGWTRWIGAAGVLGVAFGVGTLFGEGSSRPDASDPAQNLDLVNAETDRYEELRERLRLTFHQELTAAVDQTVKKARDAAGNVALSLHDAGPEPAAEPAPSTPPPTPAHSPAVAPPAGASAAAAPVAPAPATPVAARAAVPSPDVDDDDDEGPRGRARLAQALSRVLGEDAPAWAQPEDEPARAAPAQARPAPARSGGFVVQVASFPTREAARRLADKLETSGHRTRLTSVELDHGTVYRVLVVGFGERTAAERARDGLQTSFGLKGLVRGES